MPRPGEKREKAKDLKKTLLRIFKSLKKWRYILVISCLLSIFAAVLSTIAPNKLSDLTNVVSDGIKPNTENMELVSKEIMKNVSASYIKKYSKTDNVIYEFNLLSDNEKKEILDDIVVKGVTISDTDQIKYLNIIGKMDKDASAEENLKSFDKMPKSIRKLTEAKIDNKKFKKKVTTIIIIYLLNAIFGYVVGIMMAYVGIGYSKRLRGEISGKINRLPLRYFDNHEIGDVLSRVTNDVDTIGINMSNNITALTTNLTLFLGSIVMMFVTNWVMAFTAIGASIFGFFGSFILLMKSQKYFTERQKQLGDLNGHIEEIYSGHNVVKT